MENICYFLSTEFVRQKKIMVMVKFTDDLERRNFLGILKAKPLEIICSFYAVRNISKITFL